MTVEHAVGGTLTGPFDQGFWFSIPVPLQSKSNFRRSSRRGEWSKLGAFDTLVAAIAREHRPAGWELGDRAAKLPSRPQVVAFIWARSPLDAANFSKSLLDALEGTVYWTDASVRYVASLGQRVRTDQRAVALFARLSPDASPAELLAAAHALERHWLEQIAARPAVG